MYLNETSLLLDGLPVELPKRIFVLFSKLFGSNNQELEDFCSRSVHINGILFFFFLLAIS